jgi:all-trans-retinol 13,14-reductase
MGLQDVGAHVWEGMNAKEPFAHVLAAATCGAIDWNLVQEESFKVYIGEELVVIESTWKAFRENLVKRFPDEEVAIDKFHALVEETRKNSIEFMFSKLPLSTDLDPVSHRLSVPMNVYGKGEQDRAMAFREISGKTVDEVLDGITINASLRYLLCALWFKCGLPPDVLSWGAFALVVGQFLDGVAYPTGGSKSIEEALVKVIERNGGRVFVDTKVESLFCEKNVKVSFWMAEK